MASNSVKTIEKIKQTSRTILFEEFTTDPSSLDLVTLLDNSDVKNTDEFLKKIETLEVRSFEEFLSKFSPTIWEWVMKDGDKLKFCYSVGEKPANADVFKAKKINLCEHEFYAMVMDLYNKKGVSGEGNLDFDYSRIAELLSPKKLEEKTNQLRKSLEYNRKQLLELAPSRKVEIQECNEKIRNVRRDIARLYKDSPTGILKLALIDNKKKIDALGGIKEISGDNATTQPLLPCKYSLAIDGSLKVEVIDVEETKLLLAEQESETQKLASAERNEYIQKISNDYDKYSGEIINTENEEPSYMKSIITSIFFDAGTQIELSKEKLIQNQNNYVTVYQSAQQEFAKTVSKAIEKLLNVKVFFDNATVDNNKLDSSLIVTNCKIDKVLENPIILQKFEEFIKQDAVQIENKKIWFAIIPAIGDIEFADKKVLPDDHDFDDLQLDDEERDPAEIKLEIESSFGEMLVSPTSAIQMITILKKAKITTFTNFKANEKTGFTKFNSEIIKSYYKKFDKCTAKDYAILSYPNFTILPRKETTIEIGSVIDQDGDEIVKYIDINGIYIDSSYLSAGLVVGSQSQSYLKAKGYKVNPDNVCVRFDLEDGDNKFILQTTLNREGYGKWAYDLENHIDENNYGFVFCGNSEYYKNQPILNSYVYRARRLNKSPIFSLLLRDFIFKYIDKQRITDAFANDFVNNTVSEWTRESESGSTKDYINNILREGENIKYNRIDGEGRIAINFKNLGEPVPINITVSDEE